MSARTNAGRLGVCLLLALAGVLGPVEGQEKGPPPAAPDTAKTRSIVYLVQQGSAKELAAVLSKHFQGEAVVQVLETPSNAVQIDAPAALFKEITELLGQIDRRPQTGDKEAKTITVEVWIAEVPARHIDDAQPDGEEKDLDAREFNGPAADIVAKLEAMRQAGQIGTLQCLQLSLVEGRQAVTYSGEVKLRTRAIMMARKAGAIRATRLFERLNVGTQLRATAHVDAGQKIELDLELTDNRLVHNPTAMIGRDENGAPVFTADTATAIFRSKLSLMSGQALAVECTRTVSKPVNNQNLIVVTATLGEPEPVIGRGPRGGPMRNPPVAPPAGARPGPNPPPGK